MTEDDIRTFREWFTTAAHPSAVSQDAYALLVQCWETARFPPRPSGLSADAPTDGEIREAFNAWQTWETNNVNIDNLRHGWYGGVRWLGARLAGGAAGPVASVPPAKGSLAWWAETLGVSEDDLRHGVKSPGTPYTMRWDPAAKAVLCEAAE